MRIQNNITAMNTHRQYTINNDNVAKAAEKLSSGYRINRAADDAAGLAISEKMRSQIRGLNMATKNSQDAISLVQTAEGALQETHSMLQRMNELAVQAATGTNQDFDKIQAAKEFEQLKREINDVAESTTFNNMKILDGSLSYKGYERSAATAGVTVTRPTENSSSNGPTPGATIADLTPTDTGLDGTETLADQITVELKYKDADGKDVTATLTSSIDAAKLNAPTGDTIANIAGNDGIALEGDGWKATLDKDGNLTDIVNTSGTSFTDGNVTVTFGGGGAGFTAPAAGTGTLTSVASAEEAAAEAAKNGTPPAGEFQIGSFTVATGAMDAKITFGDGTNTADVVISMTAGQGATDAATALDGQSFTLDGKTYNIAKSGTDTIKVTAADASDLDMTGWTMDVTKDSGAGSITAPAQATITGVGGDAESLKGKAPEEAADDDNAAAPVTGGVIEFGFDKMREGDKVEIAVGSNGAKITVEKQAGATRESFIKDLDAAIKTAVQTDATLEGKLKVSGTAIVADDDVLIGEPTWAEEGNSLADAKTTAMRIQVGALENEQLNISIDSMNTAGLGLDGHNLNTQDSAGKAITAVRAAVNKVSDQRATLGAMQNRLDHKIANLKVSSENLSAAESRIRDVDMASEMTNFTKNNILSQAATAMLAQANALPQNVLSLLG